MGDWPDDLAKLALMAINPNKFSFANLTPQSVLLNPLVFEQGGRVVDGIKKGMAFKTTVLSLLTFTNPATTQHYEIDARLRTFVDGDDPASIQVLASIVEDKTVPLEQRAKLLEVMILRGSSNEPYRSLLKTGEASEYTYGTGLGERGQQATAAYQIAAHQAILNAGPELFMQLSKSGDNFGPPSDRQPATEAIYQMLREGGTMGDFHSRQEILEKWAKQLPPETQGRLIFHLADAANTHDYHKGSEPSGFEVSVMEIGFGVQWNQAPDSHWRVVGDDLANKLRPGLNPSDNDAFVRGFRRKLPE